MNLICSVLLIVELVCGLIGLAEVLYERYEDYKYEKQNGDDKE